MRVTTLYLSALLLALSTVHPAAAQSTTKTLMIQTVGGEPIVIEKGDYDQTEDWIKNLSFVVKNVSERPVTHFEFTVAVRGSNIQGRPASMLVSYGDPKKTGSDAKALNAAKTVRIKVSTDGYESLRAQLLSVGMRTASTIVVRLKSVRFADGAYWKDGRIVQP